MNDVANWNTVILAATGLVTVLTPIFLALINRKAGRTLDNSEETKVSARATAESVEKVHVAVNSERTKLLEEMKELREIILVLSKDKATLTADAAASQRKSDVQEGRLTQVDRAAHTPPIKGKIS
jgi:hypothetical protein